MSSSRFFYVFLFFFFQAEDGIRDYKVTGVQTCALPIWLRPGSLCGRFRICTREGRSSGPGDCRLLRRSAQTVQRDPGVRSASLSEDLPSEAGTGLPLGVSGAPANDANRILPVGLAFFTTMQIPILTGRDIEERDRPGSPAAAIWR